MTTVNEILKSYYGEKLIIPEEKSSPKISAENKYELTTTARFFLKEAKKLISQRLNSNINFDRSEEGLIELISHLEDQHNEELSEKERDQVIQNLSFSLEDYDILTPLVNNPDVNDIIIRNYKDISIQIARKNHQTDLRFEDHETYKSFVDNLLKRTGKACTTATPIVDVAITPSIRANVTHESFSPINSGPMLTLRIARHHGVDIQTLEEKRLAPRAIFEYLSAVVKSGLATILISGEVATGKTTLLKALLNEVDEDESILIIEDTHEIVLDRKFTRTLITREANSEGVGKISSAAAIKSGMRMAMNRVILGEMRDPDAAESFVDVCSSGHCGISTIHAKGARDAFGRLELFLARAQPGVSRDDLRKQICDSLSVLIHIGICKFSGRRVIKEIVEVDNYSDQYVQLSKIFTYNYDKRPYWHRDSGISQYEESINNLGFVMPIFGEHVTFDQRI